jgi:hypothetical protein
MRAEASTAARLSERAEIMTETCMNMVKQRFLSVVRPQQGNAVTTPLRSAAH